MAGGTLEEPLGATRGSGSAGWLSSGGSGDAPGGSALARSHSSRALSIAIPDETGSVPAMPAPTLDQFTGLPRGVRPPGERGDQGLLTVPPLLIVSEDVSWQLAGMSRCAELVLS